MKLEVTNLQAKKAGEIQLDDAIFGLEPRADILHRMVKWQLAKRRAGTHRIKLRGEIARTKTKWFRQKGTGRARHGARTPGIFVGGAKAHGPQPRDYTHALPKKVRALALKLALSSKAGAKTLIVVEDLAIKAPKTADLRKTLAKLKLENALFIGGPELDRNFALAARNIPNLDVLPIQGLNVYDVLRRDTLVLTREAVDAIHARFNGAPAAEEAA